MRTSSYTEALVFARAGTRERRVAALTVVVCVAVVLGVAPIARASPGVSRAVLVAVCSLYAAAAALTAWLLRGQYRVSRSLSIGVLGVAHAYGAVLILAYLVAFPKAFGPAGPIGLQAAAWFWISGHVGLAALGFAYVVADRFGMLASHRRRGHWLAGLAVVAGLATIAAIVAIAVASNRLPAIVLAPDRFSTLFLARIVPGIIVLYAGAIAAIVLGTRLKTATNLWLTVIYIALLCEVLAGGVLAGARFTVGWYVGCAETAVASCSFLFVLLGRMNAVLVAFAADNRTLTERTLRDSLTELLNRRGFDERLHESLRRARREGVPSSLLIVDIDHFKAYNDHFGHLAGDDALRAIAAAIAGSAVRTQDSTCRIGGEEFAMVLPATDGDGALAVANRIRRTIAALGLVQAPAAGTALITVSIGVATASRENSGAALRLLHARSDAALYEAKRRGRDRIGVAQAPPDLSARTVS